MAVKAYLKRELRNLQSLAPAVRTAKFSLYNFGTRSAGLFVEPEFKLLAHLRPVSLAIDIGGNWGQSVLALQRYAAPERIVTFEPNPELYRRLSARFRSDPSVQVENVGLGDAAGQFDLHIPLYRNFVYDGLASLNKDEAAQWLNHRTMARFDPSKLTIQSHTVRVVKLDDYNLVPDIIKIDVQGLEDAVARGGIKTIDRAKPAMIVEAPSASFVQMMADCGLRPYTWNGTRLVDAADGSNVMFLSDEKLRKLVKVRPKPEKPE